MAKTGRLRTDTLMRRIFKAQKLDDVLRQNEPAMQPESFCALLASLCRELDTVPERVIRRAEIERSYGHQLFNGTRQPSRDKVLQLAFGFGLDVDRTQRLLRAAGKSPLYPRLKRDTVFIYALANGLDVLRVQELLQRYDLTLLGGMEKNEG